VALGHGDQQIQHPTRDQAEIASITWDVNLGQAADQAATAALPAARNAGSFIFEYAGPGMALAISDEQRTVALLALLLISLVVFLRVMVAEAKTRRMSPLLYTSLAIIVVVGTWLLAAR